VRHYNARQICEHCFASTRGPLCYKDCRQNANHTLTPVSFQCYLRTTNEKDRSPWSFFEDFTLEASKDDPQHVLYNKGVASDCVAAVIKSLCEDGVYGTGDLVSRINEAYVDFMQDDDAKKRDSHTPKPFSIRRLAISDRRKPTVACGYKHGQIRTMLHWCAKKTSQYQDTPLKQLRHRVVGNLSAFVHHLDSAGAMLTNDERDIALKYGVDFFDSFTLLHELDVAHTLNLWTMRPKVHQLFHILDHLKISNVNPLYQWACWSEEDYMGKQSKIVKACHPSISGLHRALQRYVLYLHSDLLRSLLL
jgi:hypothetical protein